MKLLVGIQGKVNDDISGIIRNRSILLCRFGVALT